MPDGELVVNAFFRIGKSAWPIGLTKVCERIFSAGDDFVGVALMSDIPEQFIIFKIEDVMQRQGQFNNAEIAGEMAAGFADGPENQPVNLVGQDLQLAWGQFL